MPEQFPKLPGCQALSDRLNRLAPAFQALAEIWLNAIWGRFTGRNGVYRGFLPHYSGKRPTFRAREGRWLDRITEKTLTLVPLTPGKKLKGDILISGNVFSAFIRSVRQTVECFFNWLNRLTNYQYACMVRSLPDLLLHAFGRIAAALSSLLFNP